MKTLLIMRHAKSDYPAQIASDFDRPLNKRGTKDVPRMARALRTTTLIPDRILSSPARRARRHRHPRTGSVAATDPGL